MKDYEFLSKSTILNNRYKIEELVGYGGYVTTYKAYDNETGETVVINEFFSDALAHRNGETNIIIPINESEYYKVLERYSAEIKKLFSLKDIKGIIGFIDIFEGNNTLYAVKRHIDYIKLINYIKQEGGKLDCDEALAIIMSLIDTLKSIHNKKIIHRNISPNEIWLCEGVDVRLTGNDSIYFLDKTVQIEQGMAVIFNSTYGCAPIEVYKINALQGTWTDIYALCATFYYMITGVVPDESVNRIIEDNVKSPKELDDSIPEYISNAIMKGMELDYKKRFQNVEELEGVLKNKKVVRYKKHKIKL